MSQWGQFTYVYIIHPENDLTEITKCWWVLLVGFTDKLKALSLLYISGLPSLQQWVHTGFLIHVRYKKIPSGS